MKKTSTTYNVENEFCITVNEEAVDYISIHDFGEPCSGILKHWGSKKTLIAELRNIIKEIENLI